MTTISVGSLDDPSVFKPEFVCYTSRGHAWDRRRPGGAELPEDAATTRSNPPAARRKRTDHDASLRTERGVGRATRDVAPRLVAGGRRGGRGRDPVSGVRRARSPIPPSRPSRYQRAAERPRRSAPAPGAGALAGARDGRRTGRRACRSKSCGRSWTTGERTTTGAAVEARLNGFEQYRTRDRRPRHPLPARPLAACGCAADRHHAWLAGLRDRVPRDHRAFDRSDRAWRRGAGRVPRRRAVAAGLRVLRQARRAGLGFRAHRQGLGRADGPARLHPLRRPGRRLGRRGHHPRWRSSRPPGLAAIHLNFPLVFPDPLPTTGLSAEEQRAVDALARFQMDGVGYFFAAVDAPADDRLCARRTRRWDRPPGSTRNSMPGPTMTAIPRTRSRATRCSTTSRSTG